MKKTIALLLALLLVTGAVFAEVIEIDGDNETPTPAFTNYTMNLKAVVPEGGGLDNGDGDDPDTIKNGGLYIMVGYNYKNSYKNGTDNNGYTMGSPYATEDLEDLGTYDTSNPLTVSLTPENDNDKTGTLQFYVAAKSNASKARTTEIKFASTGFTKQEAAGEVEQQSNKTIGITFAGVSDPYDGENGLHASVVKVGGTITVRADEGSQQENYIYVARTDASWEKDASLPAGTYTATITVTVSATV